MVGNRLAVLLALCGLTSGLLTDILMYPQEEAGLLSGALFGLFLVVPLVVTGVLRNPAKALGLIGVTTVAYFLSFTVAFGLQLHHPELAPSAERWDMSTNEPAAPAALFVGGLVGGFILFSAALFLCQPGISKRTLVQKAFQGAVLGGVLGAAGWALRSSVGVAIWNLLHAFGLTPKWELSPQEWFKGEHDYGERARMYSLYVVWQSGVAAAIGLMLRRVSIQKAHDKHGLRLFAS
jgi:hypothetical protein